MPQCGGEAEGLEGTALLGLEHAAGGVAMPYRDGQSIGGEALQPLGERQRAEAGTAIAGLVRWAEEAEAVVEATQLCGGRKAHIAVAALQRHGAEPTWEAERCGELGQQTQLLEAFGEA